MMKLILLSFFLATALHVSNATGGAATSTLNDDVGTTCPENCKSYYDGCNTCSCDPDTGAMLACTEVACFTYGTAHCSECDSNFVWVGIESTADDDESGCGDPCWQENTCYADDVICIASCQDQCQCPTDYPIYDCTTNTCITSDECPSEDEWEGCDTSDSDGSGGGHNGGGNGGNGGGPNNGGGNGGSDSMDDTFDFNMTQDSSEDGGNGQNVKSGGNSNNTNNVFAMVFVCVVTVFVSVV